ncbi:hypothetical protein Patl1_03260 [Pistacia atlantica]|uniref:Uncharacterized protein n=1 Tax=Pistacia atlantica TaxID=434234 RepID=A0ACC1CAQ5_9ROSI|nr:hypothetical protein Patl1_03260 [Pistacia atlantica]
MASSRLRCFLSLYFIYHFDLTIADEPKTLYHDCYVNNGTYTTNSPYQANLNELLILINNATPIYNGFYHSSYGERPDKVYAIATCRPDMEPVSCRNCLNAATKNLPSLCPNFLMAIGGYDDGNCSTCMLHYAFYDMIGIMETAPHFFVYSESNITKNVEDFNQIRQSLLTRMISEAAAPGSKKYATGEVAVSDIVTLYGLVQCTPDLTESQCNDCLLHANKLMPNCCNTSQGGRVITPSCSFRYGTNKFYKSSTEGPPVSFPPPSTNTTTHKGKNIYLIIIIVVVTSAILHIGIVIFLRWRKSEEDESKLILLFHYLFRRLMLFSDLMEVSFLSLSNIPPKIWWE